MVNDPDNFRLAGTWFDWNHWEIRDEYSVPPTFKLVRVTEAPPISEIVTEWFQVPPPEFGTGLGEKLIATLAPFTATASI